VGPESARRRHISPWTPIVLINFPLDAPSARANIPLGGKMQDLCVRAARAALSGSDELTREQVSSL